MRRRWPAADGCALALTPLCPPRSYQAVYADAKEEDELVLLTAPLSSTTEIEALYTSCLLYTSPSPRDS